MMRSLLFVLLLLLCIGTDVLAQGTVTPQGPDGELMFRRRVEALVRAGRSDEAVQMLEERREGQGLDTALSRRLARLYRDLERWDDLERQVLAPVDGQVEELETADLRLLVDACFGKGDRERGIAVVERIRNQGRRDPGVIRLVASLYMQQGMQSEAIATLREGRVLLERPREFAQLLGRLHAERGEAALAAGEYALVVASGPLNISIIRAQLMELVDRHPGALPEMTKQVQRVMEQFPDVSELRILEAELLIARDDPDAAWRSLRSVLVDPEMSQELLRMALAAIAESQLPEIDAQRSLRRLHLSVRITRGLLGNEVVGPVLEPRVHDALIRGLLAMFESESFGLLDDAERDELLEDARLSIFDMQERYPGNRITAAAQLRLAEVYLDAMHRPHEAVTLFRDLVDNPNSAREDVLLARMGVGRAMIATADTASARVLLSEIGRDSSEPGRQGRAQYHLGMLDFMGGDIETAEDRFRAVAIQNPRADYSNDALDLAIVITAEEFSGQPNREGLLGYGRALYHRATFAADSALVALRRVAEGRGGAIRERARLDLAGIDRDAGHSERALTWLEKIVVEAPESRWASQALDLRGQILVETGRFDQAIEAYERIVIEYTDYVHVDQIRDRIAALRNPVEEEGDLP